MHGCPRGWQLPSVRRPRCYLEGRTSIIFGLEPDNLYCCDQRPPEISDTGLAGPLVEQGSVLLAACNTDWLKWNNQPEYAKTAMVVRSERETKPSGVVLVEKHMGVGRLLVTTLPAAPNTVKAGNDRPHAACEPGANAECGNGFGQAAAQDRTCWCARLHVGFSL